MMRRISAGLKQKVEEDVINKAIEIESRLKASGLSNNHQFSATSIPFFCLSIASQMTSNQIDQQELISRLPGVNAKQFNRQKGIIKNMLEMDELTITNICVQCNYPQAAIDCERHFSNILNSVYATRAQPPEYKKIIKCAVVFSYLKSKKMPITKKAILNISKCGNTKFEKVMDELSNYDMTSKGESYTPEKNVVGIRTPSSFKKTMVRVGTPLRQREDMITPTHRSLSTAGIKKNKKDSIRAVKLPTPSLALKYIEEQEAGKSQSRIIKTVNKKKLIEIPKIAKYEPYQVWKDRIIKQAEQKLELKTLVF